MITDPWYHHELNPGPAHKMSWEDFSLDVGWSVMVLWCVDLAFITWVLESEASRYIFHRAFQFWRGCSLQSRHSPTAKCCLRCNLHCSQHNLGQLWVLIITSIVIGIARHYSIQIPPKIGKINQVGINSALGIRELFESTFTGTRTMVSKQI